MNAGLAVIAAAGAVCAFILLFGTVWGLLFAHGEREAEYIDVEAEEA